MTKPSGLTFRRDGAVPAVEQSWDRVRREWNLLIRRPFYLNLRLGRTQNALWLGRGFDGRRGGRCHAVFNCFPFPWSDSSVCFGHVSRRTVKAMREYIHDAELKRMECDR